MSTTATDLINVLNVSETATEMEYVMQLGIDALNIFGCNISPLTGAVGAKTVTLTSAQRGGVFIVSRIIYASFYQNASNKNDTAGGISQTSVGDLMSNTTTWTTIKEVAEQLKDPDTTVFRLKFKAGENDPNSY